MKQRVMAWLIWRCFLRLPTGILTRRRYNQRLIGDPFTCMPVIPAFVGLTGVVASLPGSVHCHAEPYFAFNPICLAKSRHSVNSL
jgi:hypothetical protein